MSKPEIAQEPMLGNEPITEPVVDAVAEVHTDTLPSIEEQFRQLELKAAEHYDAWLRAKAEGENIRRRAQEDISKAHKFAVEKFAGELVSAFEKNALQAVNPVGEKFDPHKHQAIGMVDSEQEANTVVTVLQKGYLIAERTLRPALVMVAKPKS
jgi:molecular chaperone GrpE